MIAAGGCFFSRVLVGDNQTWYKAIELGLRGKEGGGKETSEIFISDRLRFDYLIVRGDTNPVGVARLALVLVSSGIPTSRDSVCWWLLL